MLPVSPARAGAHMTFIRSSIAILACSGAFGCADLDFHPLRNLRDAVHGEPRINDNVFLMRNGGKQDDYADVPAVIPPPCLPPPTRAISTRNGTWRQWTPTKSEPAPMR